MKRRTFIQKSVLATEGLPLVSLLQACNTADSSKEDKVSENLSDNPMQQYIDNIGIQLWTVRNQMAEDPATTLKTIKDLGYHQIEMGSIMNMSNVVEIAKDLDLKINSSFFSMCHLIGGWEYMEAEAPKHYNFENVLEDAQKIGIDALVFGYLFPQQRGSLDAYRSYAEVLNKAGEQCKNAGIQLCYHNHSFEFEPMEDSNPFEILIQDFDKDLVKFELDVFWASIGNYDPIELMERLDGRIHQLHLKDKLKDTPTIFDESKVPEEAYKELGNGVVDIKTALSIAEKIGVKYCHVEQDYSPNPLESIEVSMDYLKNLG